MEDKVKLANILETLIQCLNKNLIRREFKVIFKSSQTHLYQIKDAKFRLAAVHTENEVESCVVAIDQLIVGASYGDQYSQRCVTGGQN